MEQVLNAKERSQAFWKFLLFFFIAVIAIVLAVFFNYQVPKKMNTLLIKRADQYQVHSFAEEKFTGILQETNLLLDSLDKPGANVAYLNQLISQKLAEMTPLKDNSASNRISFDITLKYQQAINKLVKLNDAATQLEKAKNDLSQCNQELQQVRQTLKMYQNNGSY